VYFYSCGHEIPAVFSSTDVDGKTRWKQTSRQREDENSKHKEHAYVMVHCTILIGLQPSPPSEEESQHKY
jgi:hypothetical protein